LCRGPLGRFEPRECYCEICKLEISAGPRQVDHDALPIHDPATRLPFPSRSLARDSCSHHKVKCIIRGRHEGFIGNQRTITLVEILQERPKCSRREQREAVGGESIAFSVLDDGTVDVNRASRLISPLPSDRTLSETKRN